VATTYPAKRNGSAPDGGAPTVLVTGGGGYIGCVLVERLLDRGYRVRVLDQLYWGEKPLADLRARIELVKGDIRDVRDEWLDGVDAVVHLAGLSNDPTAEYDPEANWQMNAVGTEKLAIACKRAGISRFTFGSSCSLYDGLPTGPVYDETAAIQPMGAYAEGKHYAEQRLHDLTDDRFAPAILRQATVYGFSPRMRYDLVVNTFVKDAMQGNVLQLHGDGVMWRPLVDVIDVADAHIACLEAPEDAVRGQVFNVVQDNYQVCELARLVSVALATHEFHVQLQSAPMPPRVRDYRCSNDKMTRVLGFTPGRTIPMSIAHLISWIRSDGYMDFTNPRFYNIRWMELLKEQESAPHAPSVAADRV
jgi:nucleoside-diphosphate-sugar epimerase